MKKYMFSVSLLMIVLSTGSLFGQVFGPDCPTLEQQQATYNRRQAASVTVINTSTQQLQMHYQQLATYYQQLDKDNQQKAKDIQQIQKDAQQIAKDAELAKRNAQCENRETQVANRATAVSHRESQQNSREIALNAREADLIKREEACKIPVVNPWKDDGKGGLTKTQCGEKWEHNEKGTFIDGIPLEECIKMKGEAALLSDEDYNAFKEEYRRKHTNRSGHQDGTNPGGQTHNINGFDNPGYLISR